jgi:hypothetical protein
MITLITALFSRPNKSQLSALYSWSLNELPVIVASKVDNPDAVTSRFSNVRIIQDVSTEADFGIDGDAPLIKSMLQKALPKVQTPMVGLINSDILLRTDFSKNLTRIVEKNGENIFLSTPRYDVSWSQEINNLHDHQVVWDRATALHQDQSGDIFIGSLRMFQKMKDNIPDFFLGRMVWDNWIHIFFKDQEVPCYNCVHQLPTAHLSHGYEHLSEPLPDNKGVKHNFECMNCHPCRYQRIGTWPLVP